MRRLIPALAAAMAVVALPSAAQALAPFHGYTPYHHPCAYGTDSRFPTSAPLAAPGQVQKPHGCMGSTEFGWFSGRPVTFRMTVWQAEWEQDLRKYTQAIDRMGHYGVKPYVVLMGRIDDPPRIVNGSYAKLWAIRDWTMRVAQALGPSVQDYEIWNEPNHSDYWRGSASAMEYADAYCFMANGVRTDARSTARIHLGGVATNGTFSENNWLVNVKARINTSCPSIPIDGVSYHPYTSENGATACPSPTDPQLSTKLAQMASSNASEFGAKVYWFRQYMDQASVGLSSAMLMLTELGYQKCWSTSYGQDLHKRQVMALLDKCWELRNPYLIRACYWFPLVDTPTEVNLPQGGLVEEGTNAAKPAFWEFRDRLITHP